MVLGPVPLAEAPLFAMVSGQVEIIDSGLADLGRGEAA
jgi:hypothetical protein